MKSDNIDSPDSVSVWVGTFGNAEALDAYVSLKREMVLGRWVTAFEVETGLALHAEAHLSIHSHLAARDPLPVEELLRVHGIPDCAPIAERICLAARAQALAPANAWIACLGVDYGKCEADRRVLTAAGRVRFLGTFRHPAAGIVMGADGKGVFCLRCHRPHDIALTHARFSMCECPCGALGAVFGMPWASWALGCVVEALDLRYELADLQGTSLLQRLVGHPKFDVRQADYADAGRPLLGLWIKARRQPTPEFSNPLEPGLLERLYAVYPQGELGHAGGFRSDRLLGAEYQQRLRAAIPWQQLARYGACDAGELEYVPGAIARRIMLGPPPRLAIDISMVAPACRVVYGVMDLDGRAPVRRWTSVQAEGERARGLCLWALNQAGCRYFSDAELAVPVPDMTSGTPGLVRPVVTLGHALFGGAGD